MEGETPPSFPLDTIEDVRRAVATGLSPESVVAKVNDPSLVAAAFETSARSGLQILESPERQTADYCRHWGRIAISRALIAAAVNDNTLELDTLKLHLASLRTRQKEWQSMDPEASLKASADFWSEIVTKI